MGKLGMGRRRGGGGVGKWQNKILKRDWVKKVGNH